MGLKGSALVTKNGRDVADMMVLKLPIEGAVKLSLTLLLADITVRLGYDAIP